MGTDRDKKIAAVRIELEVSIGADRARVWTALIDEINEWWPKDYHALERSERFVLEPRLGGRVYEDAGGEAGVLWYTIVGFDPPNNLSLAGHLVPPFAGPATTLLRLRLNKTGDNRTGLKITDSVYGLVDRNSAETMRDGWKAVFEGGLKAWVEAIATAKPEAEQAAAPATAQTKA